MMTTFAARPDWGDAYNTYGVGGLLAAGLSPAHGFGKFCLVLLALSMWVLPCLPRMCTELTRAAFSVGNNVPNIYSLALTAQNLGPWVQAIPRMFITLIGTAVYIVLAIVGVSCIRPVGSRSQADPSSSGFALRVLAQHPSRALILLAGDLLHHPVGGTLHFQGYQILAI